MGPYTMAEWEQWHGIVFVLVCENEYETGNLIIPVISECWKFISVCEGEKKENNVASTALHFDLM